MVSYRYTKSSIRLLEDPDQLAAEIVRQSKEQGIDPAALHKITNCSSLWKHLPEIGAVTD
jgi:hypothetical protein